MARPARGCIPLATQPAAPALPWPAIALFVAWALSALSAHLTVFDKKAVENPEPIAYPVCCHWQTVLR